MKGVQNWGEVAPTIILQSSYKRPQRWSKLEPIMEEEQSHGSGTLNRRVFVSMPLLLISGFLYIFLYRGLVI